MAVIDSPLAPPPTETGLAWLRKRLFSTWFDGIVTVLAGAALVWLVVTIADWAFLNAIWGEAEPARCREVTGACWAVIEARGRLILFGLYPFEEHWRSTLACLAIVATMVLSCVPALWGLKRLATVWLTGFGTFVLLMYGGVFGLQVVTRSNGAGCRSPCSSSPRWWCWACPWPWVSRWRVARGCRSSAGWRRSSSTRCARCRS